MINLPYEGIPVVAEEMTREIAYLIVSFARPESLSQIVSMCLKNPDRNVYLFVDRASANFVAENKEVIDFALSLSGHPKVHVKIATRPHGPQQGVAAGIAWAFEKEDEIVVIEDDTILSSQTFTFFEEARRLLNGDIGIICSLSIRAIDNSGKFSCKYGHFTSFALTNCWMLRKQLWLESISPIKFSHLRIKLSKMPKILPAYLFFLSGALRFDNRIGKTGWDSKMQYSLMKGDLKAFMPGSNMSGNSGNDYVASNSTVLMGNSSIHWEIEETLSGFSICDSDACNQQIFKIFKSYFQISWRSYFSPLKTIGLITRIWFTQRFLK